MKNGNILVIGTLVIVLAAILFAVTAFKISQSRVTGVVSNTAEKESAERATAGFKTISSGSTAQGDVSIDLTPARFVNGKLQVNVAVNTHSVDLSGFDLKEITTLEYDRKIVKPSSAFTIAGHHSSGALVFDVGKELSRFIIRIREIPKVDERVFEWS